MDIRTYNREAWDAQVEKGNPWTLPASPEVIAAARRGEWSVYLTGGQTVPPGWFPPLSGIDLLCLASGGGQQAPILAAAGANVTVLDNSPRQLERDRQVAEREGLALCSVEGDMRDLSAFTANSFDLIFHPVSDVFIPDTLPVWRETYRVLRPGGLLLCGFINPTVYVFDQSSLENGALIVRFPLPYSDVDSLSTAERQQYLDELSPLEWSHTLQELIGGQLGAGFHLTDFYEDQGGSDKLIGQFIPIYFATRACKA